MTVLKTQIEEGTDLLDEAVAIADAKKQQQERLRLDSITALESRILEEENHLTSLEDQKLNLQMRRNDLESKLKENNLNSKLLTDKLNEYSKRRKGVEREIRDYPAIDPNDVNEEALRENESDRKNDLTKRLGRRRETLAKYTAAQKKVAMQNETARLEMETVEMMQGKISGKKKEAIQSLRDHKKELKQQIHDKANNDKVVLRIIDEKDEIEERHHERMQTIELNTARIDKHIEDAEFIEIDDVEYLSARNELRVINMETAKLEAEKREIKWKAHVLHCKLHGLEEEDDEIELSPAKIEHFSRGMSIISSKANSVIRSVSRKSSVNRLPR